MTHLNDQALLAHWQRHRNAEAFRELASRHARMVYGTALRVLRNSEDAEDVSQECLLALAHTRRPPRRNVAAWLHRTVYRAALNYARSRTRRGARERAYAETLPDSTGAAWDEIRELLDEAVSGLPENFREPLVRHFFEAQTHESIAASLGVSRQTVTHRINQGVTMVRRRLSEKGVVAPAGAALATLIQSQSAVAEPAGLAVEIGRIAIASTPSVWATAASYAGGAGMKVAAAAVLAVVIGGAAWRAGSDLTPAPTPTPVARAAAIADEAPVADAETPPRDAVEPRLARVAPVEVAPATEPALFAASQGDHASLYGVVVLPDGRPFAGAHVWIVHPGGFDVRNGSSRAQLCVADDSGYFSQTGMAPGDYRILVTEPETMAFSTRSEVASVSLEPGEQKTGLRLVYGQEGSLTVAGVVVDAAGRPIEGVRLTTEDEVMRSALSDRDGRFALRYLPAGEVFVIARHDTYSPGRANAHGGDQDVRIVLEARGAVAGRVIDAKTGASIARFDAICRPGYLVKYRESIFQNNSGFDDREGRFRMENIPAGDATIAVRAAGYEPVLHRVTVEAGMVLEHVEIALEEARNRGFSGQVLTADGSPIAGARIYLDPLGHVSRRDGKHVTVTDAEGVFRVDDPPPTAILVHAWHPAFAPGSGKASDNTVIVLKPSARLDVEVVSGGAPMEGVTVRAVCYEALYAGNDTRAQTGANGRAVLDEITPGDVTVAVDIIRGRSWHEALYLQPGEAKALRVDIPESVCVVEGVVVVDGAIAPEALVCLYVETPLGREYLQRSTGPDGTFRFDSVPAGVAQLAAFTVGNFWRAFVDDIPLRAGEVSSVTVDATMPHAVRGAVHGLNADEQAQVLAMHGVFSLEEALATAPRRLAEPVVASTAVSDDDGAYVLPLHRPGTYTVLATVHRGEDFVHHVGYDLHVVEVSAAEDAAIDLTVQR